jgi:hypothetical protein
MSDLEFVANPDDQGLPKNSGLAKRAGSALLYLILGKESPLRELASAVALGIFWLACFLGCLGFVGFVLNSCQPGLGVQRAAGALLFAVLCLVIAMIARSFGERK